MTPGQVFVLFGCCVGLLIWAACTPPASEREYPEYWGP